MQLLPIQREFLAADPRAYNRNSQAVLLTAPTGLDVRRVVEELYRRHDALRQNRRRLSEITQHFVRVSISGEYIRT